LKIYKFIKFLKSIEGLCIAYIRGERKNKKKENFYKTSPNEAETRSWSSGLVYNTHFLIGSGEISYKACQPLLIYP
jgi:hypothetical protein